MSDDAKHLIIDRKKLAAITRLNDSWEKSQIMKGAIALHPPEGVRRKRLYRLFGVKRFKGHHVTTIRPVPDQLWPYRIQSHEWEKPFSHDERRFYLALKQYEEEQERLKNPLPPLTAREEIEWRKRTSNPFGFSPKTPSKDSPEKSHSQGAPPSISLPSQHIEGAVRQVSLNRYERNSDARERCIEYYGCRCVVCGFDFEKVYGARGKGFIHVHHIKPLSEIRKEYVIDPVADLRPVCPNCHAMIHSGSEMLSIESLSALIRAAMAVK
jgi:hypothetical protein